MRSQALDQRRAGQVSSHKTRIAGPKTCIRGPRDPLGWSYNTSMSTAVRFRELFEALVPELCGRVLRAKPEKLSEWLILTHALPFILEPFILKIQKGPFSNHFKQKGLS